MSKQHLEEFEVTLHPKPFTTKVAANFPWQAVGMAENVYAAGDVMGYGFEKFQVKNNGPIDQKQ